MSVISGTESIDFSGLPLYLKDLILEKMTFKSYATFLQTGALAVALDERNHNNLYPIDVNRITIKTDYVFLEMDGMPIPVSFDKCEKMKFKKDLHVTISPDWFTGFFSKKTCAFLLKLGEIHTLECPFLEYKDPNTAEVLKKVKIQKLKMREFNLNDDIKDFHYDTGNIEEVEIHDSFFQSLSSVKAQKTVSFSNVHVTPDDFLEYFEKILEKTEELPDWTFDGSAVDVFYGMAKNAPSRVEEKKWVITWPGEEKPFLIAEIIDSRLLMKQC